MIRILIADDLNTRAIDKLNEIPEFEIIEQKNLIPEKLAVEIKNVDAIVVKGTTPLLPAILKSDVSLKIIILTGNGANQADKAAARLKNIEIRSTPLLPAQQAGAQTAENQEHESSDVIAILKDFFNV
jgi:phosphoglycerate dehydrogenase-like enzyme